MAKISTIGRKSHRPIGTLLKSYDSVLCLPFDSIREPFKSHLLSSILIRFKVRVELIFYIFLPDWAFLFNSSEDSPESGD